MELDDVLCAGDLDGLVTYVVPRNGGVSRDSCAPYGEFIESLLCEVVVDESGDVDHDDVDIACAFEFEVGMDSSRLAVCSDLDTIAKVQCASVDNDEMPKGSVRSGGGECCDGVLAQLVSDLSTTIGAREVGAPDQTGGVRCFHVVPRLPFGEDIVPFVGKFRRHGRGADVSVRLLRCDVSLG